MSNNVSLTSCELACWPRQQRWQPIFRDPSYREPLSSLAARRAPSRRLGSSPLSIFELKEPLSPYLLVNCLFLFYYSPGTAPYAITRWRGIYYASQDPYKAERNIVVSSAGLTYFL
jgi:hypothetical protein